MACTCVVGLQWGDEAKGKIVDLLTEQHDLVVRYNGGANAGHTVVRGGQTYKLSLLPSGILTPGLRSVIANGVVVYPPRFLEEVEALRAARVRVGDNLVLSNHAHVIFPYHMEEERLTEQGGIAAPTGPAGSAVFFDCNTMHGSNGNITPYPRSNAFFVYNSVENTLQDPFCGLKPRPEHIATRQDFSPLQPVARS